MTTTMPATADGWDALLSDGGVVRIRPATAADEDRLLALHEAASDRSIYLRYFSLNRRAGDRYVDKVLHGGKDEIVHTVTVTGGSAKIYGTVTGDLVVAGGSARVESGGRVVGRTGPRPVPLLGHPSPAGPALAARPGDLLPSPARRARRPARRPSGGAAGRGSGRRLHLVVRRS